MIEWYVKLKCIYEFWYRVGILKLYNCFFYIFIFRMFIGCYRVLLINFEKSSKVRKIFSVCYIYRYIVYVCIKLNCFYFFFVVYCIIINVFFYGYIFVIFLYEIF